MSNSRALRRKLSKPAVLYRCAVCGKRFHTAASRATHWKEVPGGRICADTMAMTQLLGFRFVRGAWRTDRPPRGAAAVIPPQGQNGS